MSFSVQGRTAIVTGAAAGVGLAIARHFAESGARVVLADMDEKRLRAAAEDIDGETATPSPWCIAAGADDAARSP